MNFVVLIAQLQNRSTHASMQHSRLLLQTRHPATSRLLCHLLQEGGLFTQHDGILF